MTKKPKIEGVAKRWVELKAQTKEIDREMGELKPILEDALRVSHNKIIEIAGWRFSLVEFLKESFSLSKAKEKIDGRVLAPYITESEVVQIRASWQGGEDEKKGAA